MQPSVRCVCITADRPQFEAQMLESFRSQTYQRKDLLIYDTGAREFSEPLRAFEMCIHTGAQGRTIGALRNAANQQCDGWDIIAHLDVDDWSHPNRITEQVALLQSSGADVVGYSDMLFWRTVSDPYVGHQAWLFQCAKQLTPAVGTSLCYWRKTWERKKLSDLPKGPGGQSEYREFLRDSKVVAVSSIPRHATPGILKPEGTNLDRVGLDTYGPRMIARIHGGNFSPYNIEEQIARGSNAMPNEGWTRKQEWDQRIREILK